MLTQISNFIGMVINGIENFVQFTKDEFDVFFVLFLVFAGVVLLIMILMVADDIYKWIKGDKNNEFN